MLANVQLGPGEDAEHEEIGAGEAGGHDARDVLVGDERALEDRVVAARRRACPSVSHVSTIDVALGVARHERVDDLRVGRIGRVHARGCPSRVHTGVSEPKILWPVNP